MSAQNERVLDQFTRQASAYAALVSKQGERGDPLLALLGAEPVHRLLDVGCGSGQFAVRIAPMVAEVLGVELNPAMLDEAREHARALGVDGHLDHLPRCGVARQWWRDGDRDRASLNPPRLPWVLANLEEAGLSDLIEMREGDALQTLKDVGGEVVSS